MSRDVNRDVLEAGDARLVKVYLIDIIVGGFVVLAALVVVALCVGVYLLSEAWQRWRVRVEAGREADRLLAELDEPVTLRCSESSDPTHWHASSSWERSEGWQSDPGPGVV